MFNLQANSTSSFTNLDTTSLFDQSFRENSNSPIDTFIDKIRNLSTLVNPATFDELVGNLVILGSVSAVESYMREVIRKCVLIDSESKIKCEKHPLTYGAAISHDYNLMPEAILEDFSFAGKKNIVNALKELLGIQGHIDNSLNAALDEFSKVCHLRHCLVHRYGKLGTKNAIELGLDRHKNCIEKPLKIDYIRLQECQAICLSTVKEINNFIFRKILLRLICNEQNKKKTSVIWKWDFRQDKTLFNTYYKILVSTNAIPTTHSDLKNAYDTYRNFYRNLL